MESPRQEAGGPVQAPGARPARKWGDRKIKLAFLALTIVVVGMIVLWQRNTPLPGWGENLNAALAQAKVENRPVLAFFVSSPLDDISRMLTKNTIPKNKKAIQQGRFIKVVVRVSNLAKSEPAQRFKITSLPTMLVIGPDGVETNRREGNIGELEFRTGFLEGGEVVRPSK
jgi:hypothetical protein